VLPCAEQDAGLSGTATELAGTARTVGGKADTLLTRANLLLSQETIGSVHASTRELQEMLGALSALAADQRVQLSALSASLRRSAAGVENAATAPSWRAPSPAPTASRAKLDAATAQLQAASTSLAVVTGRIERGEGTLGKLSTRRRALHQPEQRRRQPEPAHHRHPRQPAQVPERQRVLTTEVREYGVRGVRRGGSCHGIRPFARPRPSLVVHERCHPCGWPRSSRGHNQARGPEDLSPALGPRLPERRDRRLRHGCGFSTRSRSLPHPAQLRLGSISPISAAKR
jgi:hypothetical protein